MIVLAVIVGYLIIGITVARLVRPSLLVARSMKLSNRENYYDYTPCDHRYVQVDTVDRKRVMLWTWAMVLGWPISSWVYAVNRSTMQAVDRVDPAIIEQQRRRIKKLEEELLGIGDDA